VAKRLLKPALIARLGKDYSWTAGHTGHCSMALVEIARSEITELNAVTQMRSKRQRQNERRRGCPRAVTLGQPEI